MLHNPYILLRSIVEMVENTVMLKHTLAIGGYSDAIPHYLEAWCGFYDLRYKISTILVLQGEPGLITMTLWPLSAKPIDAAKPTMPAPTMATSKFGIIRKGYNSFLFRCKAELKRDERGGMPRSRPQCFAESFRKMAHLKTCFTQ
jgi:hypothetical protein